MNKLCPILCLLLALLVLAGGCNNTGTRQRALVTAAPVSIMPLKYAQGFAVHYYDSFKVISVKSLKDTTQILARYVLAAPGVALPPALDGAVRINAPVGKVVCVSTTHMATLARLGLLDSISGVSGVPLIYNGDITGRVESGSIANLGNDELNYEKLLALAPAFVITSGGYDGGDKLQVKLNSLNVKAVVDLDYMEQNPLARAEWIKYLAAFYNREQEADSIFRNIELNYLTLKQKVKNVQARPTVFCNLPFKEIWYMPCGENYMAMLIEDAGGNFLWKDAAATNGLNLNLDYEAVYAKAAHADFWLNTGFANSLAEIQAADRKNTFFKAYKDKTVYNNNRRNTPSGGFDFWESGTVNPDLVLADLITIFHPGLMEGYKLFYYRKLQ